MRWTDADFDSLSWHDNHVHGCRFAKGSTFWLFGGRAMVLTLALIAGMVVLRSTFVRSVVRSESMAPALVPGDTVILRPAHQFGRGDVVVFTNPSAAPHR
ncbi:MAG TPA: S26 family signal peptidase [Thermoanaerobaculia bacterium]|nr:S26 family signal peptidase [Thermoanaerobaculia bacterium]